MKPLPAPKGWRNLSPNEKPRRGDLFDLTNSPFIGVFASVNPRLKRDCWEIHSLRFLRIWDTPKPGKYFLRIIRRIKRRRTK